MGAWGPESFDNDDALDWLDELVSAKDDGPIRSALGAVLGQHRGTYVEAPAASRAVAAAEVIAASIDLSTARVPREVVDWLDRQTELIVGDMRDVASEALARVEADSELQELWEESDSANAWHEAMESLKSRLVA